MAIRSQRLEYTDGESLMRGEVAWDPQASRPAPGVLVAHTWAGCGTFERGKAAALAREGYAALAIDMYGGGVVGSGPDENAKLMSGLIEDRGLLKRRMLAALEALKALDMVDSSRTAAIGYCFGGLCVLDLARSGADFQGAVSFHGLLNPPPGEPARKILSKVLVLHGWEDPMAKPPDVLALADELTGAGADWQVHAYGRAVHAFTNPAASNPAMGTVYDPDADRRSWATMRAFLAEVLA